MGMERTAVAMKTRVGITDCDHVGMAEEQAVFSANGIEMVLHQCRTEDELIDQMQEFAVIGTQYAPLTERVFQNLPNLKCVVRYGVGVNTIDILAAQKLGIAVCNVPDYGIQEVASHAVALIMALTRKIVPMNESVRNGKWDYGKSIPIYRFSDLTIGVIGIGRIGKKFAHIVRNLDCKIIACDPVYAGERKPPEYIEMTDLETLLRTADVVSIHTPLETSRNLIGERELALMKPSAYLINVSRGGIVDEAALENALRRGVIAGAACDVLAEEPPFGIHPLAKLDNFIGTPHMAWYSEQASSDLKRKLAEGMVRYVQGKPLMNRLN